MGMFDSFYFEKGVLPNNKMPPECEFQTKYLDCNLDSYTVNTTGRLYKSELIQDDENNMSRTFPTPIKLTARISVYSYDSSGEGLQSRHQAYELEFEDGWLMKATKTGEGGFEEYEASKMQSFSPDRGEPVGHQTKKERSK